MSVEVEGVDVKGGAGGASGSIFRIFLNIFISHFFFLKKKFFGEKENFFLNK